MEGKERCKRGSLSACLAKGYKTAVFGGLGISNLQNLGSALKLRWLWQQKTEPDKVWTFLPIQAQPQVLSFFAMAVETVVGNGKNTRFWTDRWLLSQSLEHALPQLFSSIAARAKKRIDFDAFNDGRWISDIKGALTVHVLIEYLHLWELLSTVVLQPEVEDTHIWKFTTSGIFSTKSAYGALFIGAVHFSPWEQIWKSWAPRKCKFFLWTVAHNKCWTADRLARRGLTYPPRCPLCDQVEETIDHLLFCCVFTKQMWFTVLQSVGMQILAPQMDDIIFVDWWAAVNNRVAGQEKKEPNSIIILGAWILWKHRNHCVFDGGTPNLTRVVADFKEEAHQWYVAGARGVSHLLSLAPTS